MTEVVMRPALLCHPEFAQRISGTQRGREEPSVLVALGPGSRLCLGRDDNDGDGRLLTTFHDRAGRAYPRPW